MGRAMVVDHGEIEMGRLNVNITGWAIRCAVISILGDAGESCAVISGCGNVVTELVSRWILQECRWSGRRKGRRRGTVVVQARRRDRREV